MFVTFLSSFQPAEVLSISVVELDVCNVPQLFPPSCHSYVRSSKINSNHLSFREHFSKNKCRESWSCSNIKNSLWILVSIHHTQVFSDPALVQEVELALPQVGDPDSVTIQVATGQEVDEGVVEVGRDGDRDTIRLNI